MNILLQIGLGLSVSFIVVWIIIIKRKVWQIKPLLGALVLTAACGSTITMGVKEQMDTKEETGTMSAEEMMVYSNALLVAEEYDEVLTALQEYSAEFGYDEECSYIAAKMKALQGNYEEAQGIYARLAESEKYADMVEDEYELIQKKAGADSSYLAMMDFLVANGLDPAQYGYTDEYVKSMEKALQITDEEIVEEILDNLEDSYDIDEYEDVLEVVETVRDLYDNCLERGYYSLNEEQRATLEKSVDELEDLEKDHAEIAQSSLIQDIKLKATLLSGEFEELIQGIGEDSGYKDLLIAAELYMNGVAEEKDFADDYVADYSERFDKVAEQLDKVLDKLEDELTKLETEDLETMVETLEKAEEDPVLYVMREQLNDEAVKENAAVSEIDLGISKIEYFYENDSLATDYFYDAVVAGKESEDAEYAQAMGKIEAIITGTDSAGIVHLNEYVNQAVENYLPIDSYEIISANASYDYEESEEDKGTYTELVTNYVSEIKSSITIGQIDTSEFDTVKVGLTISSKYAGNSEELKQRLKVYDCGAEITEFEIEKIEFDSLKTMLICDVSGSMDICIGDLKSAVNNYVSNMHMEEFVSIVAFSSSVEDSTEFTNDKERLTEFANSMNASGGTAIYDTLYYCLNNFDAEITSNDTIILMTDGQDNNGRDYATIMREIGGLAREKGVTVYTIGLGDVDAAYLDTLASSGSGKMVYVSDSESLTDFYELLQSQVDNQYMITYTAKDSLLTKNRSVEVRIDEENIFDVKEYGLYNDTESMDGSGENGEEFVPAGSLSVTGLDIRSAQKSNEDIVVHLLGTGFKTGDSAKMKLLGNMDYDVTMEYVDATRYKVLIPSSVAVGTYDLQITINDKSAYIENGFSLYEAGDTKVTKFGPYVFTSMGKSTSNDEIVLSGNVTLNGWLVFNGDVILEGNLEESTQIRMTENAGSYVTFDPDTATGIGNYFAEKGISFSVPKLGSFKLYNDPSHIYDYENYQVDSIRTTSLTIFQVVYLEAPAIKLYPDSIKLDYSQGTTVLPFQDAIFRALEVDSPFEFDLQSTAVLTNQNIGIIIDIEGKADNGRELFKDCQMMNFPVKLDKNALKIKVNTIEHKYGFGGMLEFSVLDWELGLGAEVSLNGFQIDSFLLTIDTDVSVMLGEVPLTFSNLRVGAEDIATAVENNQFGNVIFVGQMDLAVAKVSTYFPKLEPFVDDMSLVSLSDATIRFRWNPFMISTSSDIKIFDEFTITRTNFSVGNYSYSNVLLGLDNREVQGFNSSISRGFMWDIDNCHINISGTGSLSGNSRFIGVQYEGVAELNIEWWLVDMNFDQSGTALVGVYFTEYGEPQFTVAMAYQNMWGTNKKLYYYIDSNGKTGNKNGTL